MITPFSTFAAETAHAEESASGGILGALGVDVRLLILQSIAFLVLLWILSKWVYPVFIKAIDERQAALDEGLKASQEAKAQAEKAEEKIAEEIKAARKQADEMLAATHKEAANIVADAEEKASRRAENIVSEAKADMQNQLLAARNELKSETRKLVAEATEQIIGEKIDAKKDARLLDKALATAQEKA